MRAYQNVFRCIAIAEPNSVNFMRWNRVGKRINNPVRVWSMLERRMEFDPKMKYIDADFENWVPATCRERRCTFPSSYFTVAGFPHVDAFSDYLREVGLITEAEVAGCSEQLVKSVLDEPVRMFHSFCSSSEVTSRYPYSSFLSEAGQLDVVRFDKAMPADGEDIPFSGSSSVLQRLIQYERACSTERVEILKKDGWLFHMAILFASGFNKFEQGSWPSHLLYATYGGQINLENDRAVVEMGEALWYLRYDGEQGIKELATRLNITTTVLAEVLRRLKLANEVERRGRIFYDSCVINRYRLSGKSLFPGLENKDFKVFAEYANMDFNPWLL